MQFAMVRVVGVLIDSYRQYAFFYFTSTLLSGRNITLNTLNIIQSYFDTFYDVVVKAIKGHLSSSLTH